MAPRVGRTEGESPKGHVGQGDCRASKHRSHRQLNTPARESYVFGFLKSGMVSETIGLVWVFCLPRAGACRSPEESSSRDRDDFWSPRRIPTWHVRGYSRISRWIPSLFAFMLPEPSTGLGH